MLPIQAVNIAAEYAYRHGRQPVQSALLSRMRWGEGRMPLGVYVSRCSGRVGKVIDVDALVREIDGDARTVRLVDDFFEPATMRQMLDDVATERLDAVVLAGHSHEYYRKSLTSGYLLDAFADAGVNPNRIVAANLLEQVELAHPDDPPGATSKATAMVRVAMLRAQMAQDAEGMAVEPKRSVMILGITAEAIVAAQRLLRLGFDVTLADRGDGKDRSGRAVAMHATSSFVAANESSAIVWNAKLVDGDGYVGDYHVTLESPEGTKTYEVGAILLARPDHTEWVDELRTHFKVDVDEEGFARSLDPQMHPAETIEPGIMVVPPRRTEDLDRDKVAAADAAAMAIVLTLSQPCLMEYRDVSAVDETLCGGCASCTRTCAFGACYIGEDGFSHVDERRCRGCGKCVVGCPVGARDIVSSPHDYLMEAVRALAPKNGDSGVLGFLCGGCGYPAADHGSNSVAQRGSGYPASFMPIRIPCGGRLDTLYVLEAFKQGFDGVCVYRCREGHCHNLIGNLDMDRRINLLRTILRSRHIDDARLRIVDISPWEGDRFVESVEEVYAVTNANDGREAASQ